MPQLDKFSFESTINIVILLIIVVYLVLGWYFLPKIIIGIRVRQKKKNLCQMVFVRGFLLKILGKKILNDILEKVLHKVIFFGKKSVNFNKVCFESLIIIGDLVLKNLGSKEDFEIKSGLGGYVMNKIIE